MAEVMKKCKECDQTFKALRSDALYCGQNCRKAYSRRKAKIKREAKNAISAIREITRAAADSELKEIAEKAIQSIRESCDRRHSHG